MDIARQSSGSSAGMSTVVGVALLLVIVVIVASTVAFIAFEASNGIPTKFDATAQVEASESGQYQMEVAEMGNADKIRLVCDDTSSSVTVVKEGIAKRLHDPSCTSLSIIGQTEDGVEKVIRSMDGEEFYRGSYSFPYYSAPDGGFSSYCTDYFNTAKTTTLDDGTTAYVITVDRELHCMRERPGEAYALGNDIDASGTPAWHSERGFKPVGTTGTPFTGTFDGEGHTITGLTINRGSESFVGVFGSTSGATIRDVTIEDATVNAASQVGVVVGGAYDGTEVKDVHVTGEIGSNSSTQNWIAGGIVGSLNNGAGTVQQSTADVDVSGKNAVGGLVGTSIGSISNSHATGTVTGNMIWNCASNDGNLNNSDDDVECNPDGTIIDDSSNIAEASETFTGGLVGETSGTISNSSATGTVYGSRTRFWSGYYDKDSLAGGLVGTTWGGATIQNSFAMGDVRLNPNDPTAYPKPGYSGGLLGEGGNTVITDSYARGDVSGSRYGAGLIGYYWASGGNSVQRVYATGTVTSDTKHGLIRSWSADSSNINNAYWDKESGTSPTGASTSYGTPLTTDEMTGDAARTNMWDTGQWWYIGGGYPRLDWER